VGGTVLNRPGLAMIGNTVIGGFGGHCDNFNYTGMLVAVSKTPGVGVTNIQAMEVSPGMPVLIHQLSQSLIILKALPLHRPWTLPFKVEAKLVSGNQVWASPLILPTIGSSLSLGMLY
jgi:hypothetical protein